MITARQLHGVTVATVMPFQDDGSIDWASYDRLLDHCAIDRGISAVFVNGHAGEVAALTPAERVDVIAHTRRRIGADVPLLAGIVAYSTAEAVARAQEAEQAGADVAVLFPFPQFGGGGGAHAGAVLAYLQAVLDAIRIPISVFQYPVRSGAGFSTSVMAQIAQLPRMLAIKEGSGDIGVYEDNWRAVKAVAPEVAFLPSNYDWLLPQLAVGGDGILSGMGSLLPELLVNLWRASARNDLPAMREASARIYPLERSIYGAPPAMDMHTRIKVALRHLGVIDSARPRAPLPPIADDVARVVCAAVDEAGLPRAIRSPLTRTQR